MKLRIFSVLIPMVFALNACNKQENSEKFTGFTAVSTNKETAKFYIDTNTAKRRNDSLVSFNMVRVLPDGHVIQSAETDCKNNINSFEGVKFRDDGTSEGKFMSESVILPSKDNLEINTLVTMACDKADQVEAMKQELVKTDDPKLTLHLQEEDNIGLVKITVHNFCTPTPMLDYCEAWIVLRYKNQFLKKETSSTRPLSLENISQKGKFITIYSPNGGNCYNCDGIYVFKLENEKLISLGYFNEIKNDFLVSYYDVLELNELTSHVGAPGWKVYYKDLDDKIILDFEKTCNEHQIDYDKEKAAFTREINQLKKPPSNTKNKNDAIYDSLLSVLSFSKWCGLEKDYLALVSIIKNPGLLEQDKSTSLYNELGKVKKGDDTETLSDIKELS